MADLTIFSIGFILLFRSVYKKLTKGFVVAALTLALTTPSLSITEYSHGGELIFIFSSMVWMLLFLQWGSVSLISGFITISYFAAPESFWYYLIPSVFAAVGTFILDSTSLLRRGIEPQLGHAF